MLIDGSQLQLAASNINLSFLYLLLDAIVLLFERGNVTLKVALHSSEGIDGFLHLLQFTDSLTFVHVVNIPALTTLATGKTIMTVHLLVESCVQLFHDLREITLVLAEVSGVHDMVCL